MICKETAGNNLTRSLDYFCFLFVQKYMTSKTENKMNEWNVDAGWHDLHQRPV